MYKVKFIYGDMPLCFALCTFSAVHAHIHTEKRITSVTAFNSTDIRSVQDNVATPVTAMMATVCINTDALSSVFISPDFI